jgi:hypothetical protein
MIVEHVVQGTKENSFHDFNITIEGMNLIISSGSYYQAGQEKINSDTDTLISIPSPNEETNYEVWLTTDGLQVLTRTQNENFDIVDNPLLKLNWFSLQPNETDLNNAEIHFLKVVE